MSVPCEIFAELALEERAPERSGLRLIEVAAICRASGVVIPWRPFVSTELIETLRMSARRQGLTWYVEPAPSASSRDLIARDADGYVVRGTGSFDPSRLKEARRLLVLVADGEELPSEHVRSFVDAGRMTVVYIDHADEPQLLQVKACAKRWGCPVGYGRLQPDAWATVASLSVGARVLVEGLALTGRPGSLRERNGFSPHEFAELVRRVRQQEAWLRGDPWSEEPTTPRGSDYQALGDAQSLVAARPLRAGVPLAAGDVKPAAGLRGLAASRAPELLGVRLLYDREPDEPITFGVLEPWAIGGHAPVAPLNVSVVIRARNEGAWLRRSLPAILRQRKPPQEIVVVDHESSDDTRAVALAFGCQVRTIPDRQFSFGRALNLGLAATRSPWVVSLSAHCIPVHDRWLDALLVPECGQPFTAAVYGRQEPLPDTNDFDKRDLWTTFGEEPRIQQGQDYFFHNANSLIRRDVWERVPFDEALRGVEDRDWAKKVLADGYRIAYAPWASVSHYHGIHQGRNEARARRTVEVIELIQQREPAGSHAP